jgi:hypothetical protein
MDLVFDVFAGASPVVAAASAATLVGAAVLLTQSDPAPPGLYVSWLPICSTVHRIMLRFRHFDEAAADVYLRALARFALEPSSPVADLRAAMREARPGLAAQQAVVAKHLPRWTNLIVRERAQNWPLWEAHIKNK